jgi:hypothetical protein
VSDFFWPENCGVDSSKYMKFIKIVLGILAALWAVALVAKLVSGISHGGNELAFARNMGSIIGILLASAISITLFKSNSGE